MNSLYSNALGFNGGDGFKEFEAILQSQIQRETKDPINKDFGDEKMLKAWDAFLDKAFG